MAQVKPMNFKHGRGLNRKFYQKFLLRQFYFLKITGADLNYRVIFSISEHYTHRCANLHSALPRRKDC